MLSNALALAAFTGLTSISAAPSFPSRRWDALPPAVKSTSFIGIAQQFNPPWDRDSCGTAVERVGDRVFWTCRDSELFGANTSEVIEFISSTASWNDLNDGGSLPIENREPNSHGDTQFLVQYGENNNKSYFPVLPSECNPDGTNEGGGCPDGESRWVIWPDSPPVVTNVEDSGAATLYTFIKQAKIFNNFTVAIPNPGTTLYRMDYDPSVSKDTLPQVTVVAEDFWEVGTPDYGGYGTVAKDGMLYAYSQTDNRNIFLAKVSTDSVEDQSAYSFYVDGEWTTTKPDVNDSSAAITPTAGGQGTFYYSQLWESYVWIGQNYPAGSNEFYITTSPSPEGPWTEPLLILTVPRGDGPAGGAYTMQAHPALTADPNANQIYVSYTKQFTDGYTTPIYLIEFE